jgi:ribulose-phosphate 3-epimerase
MIDTRIKIAPSILSADFSQLDRQIKKVERAGADLIHIDVMDGHFVPNITIGPAVVGSIHRATRLPLDVHLMITDPGKYLQPFIKAGADMITVHTEVTTPAGVRSFAKIVRKAGVKLGISLNPNTPVASVRPVLRWVDLVLVMSVYPGFGGQEFIPAVVPKIRQLRGEFRGDISVDGGVNDKTAGCLIAAGATILASGSYIFKARDMKVAIERIRNAGRRN